MRLYVEIYHLAQVAQRAPRYREGDTLTPKWSDARDERNLYYRVKFRERSLAEGRSQRSCRNCSGLGHYAKHCENAGCVRPSRQGRGRDG